MKRDRTPFMLALVGFAFLAACIGIYFSEQAQQRAAANWVTADGTVRETSVHPDSQMRDFIPRVSYTYVVGGRTFDANRVWLTDDKEWEERAAAEAFLTRYPIGSTVTVHHDPADPQNAALILTQTSSGKWLAGAAFGLIVLIYSLIGLRRRRRGAAPSRRAPTPGRR